MHPLQWGLRALRALKKGKEEINNKEEREESLTEIHLPLT